jgi:hypothetical protein
MTALINVAEPDHFLLDPALNFLKSTESCFAQYLHQILYLTLHLGLVLSIPKRYVQQISKPFLKILICNTGSYGSFAVQNSVFKRKSMALSRPRTYFYSVFVSIFYETIEMHEKFYPSRIRTKI